MYMPRATKKYLKVDEVGTTLKSGLSENLMTNFQVVYEVLNEL